MRRRGIALGIVVAVILVLFTIAFGILKLMRGAGHQMLYADAHIRALSIAESGVQLLVARMLAKPWDERWFKGAPDARGDPIQFEGGSYVYLIQDSPGKHQVDLLIGIPIRLPENRPGIHNVA